jgi:hypothetical protein
VEFLVIALSNVIIKGNTRSPTLISCDPWTRGRLGLGLGTQHHESEPRTMPANLTMEIYAANLTGSDAEDIQYVDVTTWTITAEALVA